ncbi:MAG: CoA transferase [Dehalococcoidia bacterium]|nr:CoA transferase [Dehalococcoidia bacterium]
MTSDIREVAREPWAAAGFDPDRLDALDVTGEGNLPSAYRVIDLATASIGAAALAASVLWEDRGGPPAHADVDRGHAAAAFLSERYYSEAGEPPAAQWAPLSGDYATADGRFVRIHANFDHHRDAALAALGMPPGSDTPREAVETAVAGFDAEQLVEEIIAQGGAASSWRTPEEWHAHPQGEAVGQTPLITVSPLGDAPLAALPRSEAPLEGVRVLDLSRVLAGPVCGRFLAAYGADVLRVSGSHLPTFEALDRDTGMGKRSCFIDLRSEDGQETLRDLVRDADVFVQAYRPGSLGARGFSARELAAIRPGIVVVELSAYGHLGPWSGRRGFDSLVQMASGIVATETAEDGHARTRSLPAQALDHGTGYLAALGAIAGLHRRQQEGGSWHVQVALARTGKWLEDLGHVERGQQAVAPDAAPYLQQTGDITHVAPPGRVEGYTPRWSRPAPVMGEHAPTWDD